MHEVGPQRFRCVLVASVFAALSAAAFPVRIFLVVETEEVLRILLSGLLCYVAGAALVASVFRLPRLCWTETEISYTTRFYKHQRLSMNNFGPVTPYRMYTPHGLKAEDFLLLRPLSGGKTRHFALTCYGLTEEGLADLADRINKTRGMPFGATDTQAILETRNTTGLSALVLILCVPLVLLLYLLLR
jgi:hypothetical protein